MKSNEKPCVCNVFATFHSLNSVKSRDFSSQNVRNSFETIQVYTTQDVAGRFTTSQDICSGRFLYLFRKRTVVEFMEGTFIYWIGILI